MWSVEVWVAGLTYDRPRAVFEADFGLAFHRHYPLHRAHLWPRSLQMPSATGHWSL